MPSGGHATRAPFNFLGAEFLAQLSHVLAGAAFTALFWIFLPLGVLPWLGFGPAVILLEVGVVVKESVFDPVEEHDPPQPFFWQGAVDLSFWQPGIGLVALLLVLAHKPL